MNDTGLQPIVFSMSGAREVLSQSVSATEIERQIGTIERAIHDMPGLAFDMCKSLIETVCKTILKDRNVPLEGSPDLPGLLRQTLRCVALLPESHSDRSELRDTLRKTINGLQTIVQGLCELRNQEGMSHGKEAEAESLERIHALMAARAADAIVHFLFFCHKRSTAEPEVSSVEYDDNPEFNDYLDLDNDPVVISGLTYAASEVLFNVDQEAYLDLLGDFLDAWNDSSEIEGEYA